MAKQVSINASGRRRDRAARSETISEITSLTRIPFAQTIVSMSQSSRRPEYHAPRPPRFRLLAKGCGPLAAGELSALSPVCGEGDLMESNLNQNMLGRDGVAAQPQCVISASGPVLFPRGGAVSDQLMANCILAGARFNNFEMRPSSLQEGDAQIFVVLEHQSACRAF
jgi:hypothetical protein